MAFNDLSDSNAVIAAMRKCDELGRQPFLERYGFGKATRYILPYEGREYDSKAILGVAHEMQFGQPLTSTEFSGGKRVAKKLSELGFEVRS